jgi:hypothetical protein
MFELSFGAARNRKSGRHGGGELAVGEKDRRLSSERRGQMPRVPHAEGADGGAAQGFDGSFHPRTSSKYEEINKRRAKA